MTATATTSEPDRHDESVRDNRNVAWYGCDECEFCPPADNPIRIGEVYELVSVILKYAPFEGFRPTAECVIEVTNHPAWPGLLEMARRIDEECNLYEEARQC